MENNLKVKKRTRKGTTKTKASQLTTDITTQPSSTISALQVPSSSNENSNTSTVLISSISVETNALLRSSNGSNLRKSGIMKVSGCNILDNRWKMELIWKETEKQFVISGIPFSGADKPVIKAGISSAKNLLKDITQKIDLDLEKNPGF